jgi:YHS domain-containing protein
VQDVRANHFDETTFMMAIRKAWLAALLLTAFVGCTKEEPAGEKVEPPVPVGNEVVVPPATPPAEDKSKEGTNADMPKTDVPKEEGLKLDAPAVTPPAAKEEPKGDEAAAKTLTADELAELATLSPADKDIALKQVLCPVSGEHLGSMGAPVKVSAEGKTFMICCKSCNDDVKEKPKEVVAKLKK